MDTTSEMEFSDDDDSDLIEHTFFNTCTTKKIFLEEDQIPSSSLLPSKKQFTEKSPKGKFLRVFFLNYSRTISYATPGSKGLTLDMILIKPERFFGMN